jgi:hypothetical protein
MTILNRQPLFFINHKCHLFFLLVQNGLLLFHIHIYGSLEPDLVAL